MTTLAGSYDALFLDLDGTVYRGPHAVAGASETVGVLSVPCFYVTNNASRAPRDVAEHLRSLGFDTDTDHVVTSSQAAARLLAERLPSGASVLVVGTDALADQVAAVDLKPVREAEAEPSAVVQGFSRTTDWAILAEAALALRSGAWWVATNIDTTLPGERGLLPGNGSMVGALEIATGCRPVVAGKPARPVMDDAMQRSGARRPLVVGDRLDTDIEAAVSVGADSLLVLTGVSGAEDMIRAPENRRPTHVTTDLRGLLGSADTAKIGPQTEWDVDVAAGGDLVLRGANGASDAVSALRALAHQAWTLPAVGALTAEGSAARRVFAELALS